MALYKINPNVGRKLGGMRNHTEYVPKDNKINHPFLLWCSLMIIIITLFNMIYNHFFRCICSCAFILNIVFGMDLLLQNN